MAEKWLKTVIFQYFCIQKNVNVIIRQRARNMKLKVQNIPEGFQKWHFIGCVYISPNNYAEVCSTWKLQKSGCIAYGLGQVEVSI